MHAGRLAMLTAILALLVAGATVILWGPAVALLLLLAAAHFLGCPPRFIGEHKKSPGRFRPRA
jgi:hypothetical protein